MIMSEIIYYNMRFKSHTSFSLRLINTENGKLMIGEYAI